MQGKGGIGTGVGAQARALLLLLVHLALLVLATPGLDAIPVGVLATPQAIARAERDFPAVLVAVAAKVAWANRTLRLPLAGALRPLQRPLRIEQSYTLYANGARKVLRMEVWVDGTLRHRSADPEHSWLAPQLRSRRIRPVVATLSETPNARNRVGLMRYIGTRAAQDFGAQQVELRFTAAPFPTGPSGPDHPASAGAGASATTAVLHAMAPAWDVSGGAL